MHEVIVCEKPKASEKISAALSGKAVKKIIRKFLTMKLMKMGKKLQYYLL